MEKTARARGRTAGVISAVIALLLVWVVAPTGAAAHPGGAHPSDEHEPEGLGVLVNSPEELAGFRPAIQWSGSGEVTGQTADLVYAGTGCTPAHYAGVDVEGKIALVDDIEGQNPIDKCRTYAFKQKMEAAERAGAIGLVQVERDDDVFEGSAISSGIPGLAVSNTLGAPIRDAVTSDTTVNVTLTKPAALPRMSDVACEDGQAGPFECEGIDLLALVPQDEFNGAGISDLWGWTDSDSGDEYVIIGKTNGVAFFRITDPTDPVYLGELPNPGVTHEVWHDIKVYADHAFIVSESEPHGMTVFDLTQLRGLESEPDDVWDADAHYRMNSAAHNLEINTGTGYAYIVGGNAGLVAPDQCLSGLHMVDIRDPQEPTFAGCYLEEGGPGTAARLVGGPATELSPAAYVHDAQCVVYEGPDERYTGREICFNAAETQIVIADVTDKLAPVTLGTTDYPNVAYAHQGWLTDDHAYLIVNDELDEENLEEIKNTRTIVLDVTDLEKPKVHFEHFHDTESPDHNNYVHEGFVYQSNYSAGLRVLDVSGVAEEKTLEEVAFFDTFPSGDTTFDGTWSNYPFFDSGTIAVSGRAEGLFLLRVHDDVLGRLGVDIECVDCPVEIRAGDSQTADLDVTNTGTADDTYAVEVEGLPDGWNASVDPNEVAVNAGETRDVTVTIEVPKNERKGTYTFDVTATSITNSNISATAVVDVEVRKGAPADAGPPENRPQGQNGRTATGKTGEDAQTLVAAATGHSTSAPLVPAAATVAMVFLIAASVRRRLTN